MERRTFTMIRGLFMFSIFFQSFQNKFVAIVDSRNDDLRPFLRLTDSQLWVAECTVPHFQMEPKALENWMKESWPGVPRSPLTSPCNMQKQVSVNLESRGTEGDLCGDVKLNSEVESSYFEMK